MNSDKIKILLRSLQKASAKLEEKEKAKQEMYTQVDKLKRLSSRKNVKKETIGREYDALLNTLNKVIEKEKKIINYQHYGTKLTKQFEGKVLADESDKNTMLEDIKALEEKLLKIAEQDTKIITELNSKIAELENKLSDKKDLQEKVDTLKQSLNKIQSGITESSDREKRIEMIENKIKDKVYQDSIRLKRIVGFIRKLEQRYAELKSKGMESKEPKRMKRLKERIDTLKDKHEDIKKGLPKPDQTLSYEHKELPEKPSFPSFKPEVKPEETISKKSLKQEETSFNPELKVKERTSFPSFKPEETKPVPESKHHHLLDESGVRPLKEILKKPEREYITKIEEGAGKSQKPPMPPPPMPELPKEKSLWEKVKGFFGFR